MAKKTGPKGLRPWLVVLIALLDDIAILALAVVVLYLLDFSLPVPLLITIGVLLAAAIFFLHKAITKSLKRRLVTGAEGMIGATGKATELLNPAGMVLINGEYWKAFCLHGKIDKGNDVEVVGINGLDLEVKEKEH